VTPFVSSLRQSTLRARARFRRSGRRCSWWLIHPRGIFPGGRKRCYLWRERENKWIPSEDSRTRKTGSRSCWRKVFSILTDGDDLLMRKRVFQFEGENSFFSLLGNSHRWEKRGWLGERATHLSLKDLLSFVRFWPSLHLPFSHAGPPRPLALSRLSRAGPRTNVGE